MFVCTHFPCLCVRGFVGTAPAPHTDTIAGCELRPLSRANKEHAYLSHGQPGPKGEGGGAQGMRPLKAHTEQSTHQAAIWAALVYAGTCLTRGSRVTLTIVSVTALRNLRAAPADAEAQHCRGASPKEGRRRRRRRETGRRGQRRAAATNDRDLTRGLISREDGRRTNGKQGKVLGLATQH